MDHVVSPCIDICICTFRRPAQLQRLLQALLRLQTDDRFTYSIIVGDNDRAESAREVVASFSSRAPIPTTYCVEPVRNIARVRNRVVGHAQGEFIAFLDDDESPTDQWLLFMLTTCEMVSADGVLGPVVPQLDENVPVWFRSAGFYDFRKRYPTGQKLLWPECRTGNALLRREIFRELNGPFREEFGTGGEDQDFFRRSMEQGRFFVWCDEAVVYETIEPTRWKRRVLLSRALLRGKDTFRHREERWESIGKALIAVPLYSLALPFSLLAGQHRFMSLANKLTSHVGLLLACVGLNPAKHRPM